MTGSGLKPSSDPFGAPYFTNDCSASSASLEQVRDSMRGFLAKYGPPRCAVILPNGSFFSGTIEEMRDLLVSRCGGAA